MKYHQKLHSWFVFMIVATWCATSVAQEPTTKPGSADEKTSPKEVQETEKSPIGASGLELERIESDFEPDIKRLIIPPYYREKSEGYQLRLFFPVFFYREKPTEKGTSKDLGILPFYWQHRKGLEKVDVAFPFYWRMRNLKGGDTDVVLQTYYNRSNDGYNFGFAPLVFLGKNTKDKSSYQVIPPLFWRFTKEQSSFLLAGIFYNSKKGDDYDVGLPPLFFAGRNRYKTYMVASLLFWRFTNEIEYTTKNVLPPFFFNTRENGWSFGMLPLLYLARDKAWDKTLVFPFYYGSRWTKKGEDSEILGEGRSHYLLPLLTYHRRAPGLLQHGSSVFYHWHEKDGDYLRMFTPMLWMWGNKRTDDSSVLVPPLAYFRKSPVRTDRMLSLIYWDFHDHHKERTVAIAPLFARNWSLHEDRWRLWMAPTFDFGKNPNGYHARFHPLFYVGRNENKSHFVLTPLFWRFKSEEYRRTVLFPLFWNFNDLVNKDSATVVPPIWWQFDDPRRKKYNHVAFPLFWDFKNDAQDKRTTVVAPLFWRHKKNGDSITGVLNVYVKKGEEKKNPFWEFNIFPLLGFGHPPSPEGAYWSVLGGLAGWRRQGSTKQLKLLWIPISVGQ